MKTVAFTIVLNGMPFIQKQAEIIPQIFDEWYIVEGASLPVKDTAWCGFMDTSYYTADKTQKLSVDGTTEFLDSIASDKIKIIRRDGFWQGKVEMCNSFMHNISDCVLMEFDVDEIWAPDTLRGVLDYAKTHDDFDAMLFKCRYFVGPNIVVTSENCWSDGPYEWIRLWKVKNQTSWITHEPPRLASAQRHLTKAFTVSKGWLFDHYGYVLESQLKFKENYYRYADALANWKRLQLNPNFPCRLKPFLPWVSENTVVDLL